MWTLEEALAFISHISGPLEVAGYSVGLTGSVLKRGTSQHDLDIILYPLSTALQNEKALHQVLKYAGLTVKWDRATVEQAWRKQDSLDEKCVEVYEYREKRVDIFFLK